MKFEFISAENDRCDLRNQNSLWSSPWEVDKSIVNINESKLAEKYEIYQIYI